MNHVKTFDPRVLLGDRLELTLYGMFAEAYVQKRSKTEPDLYQRWIKQFPGERSIHRPEVFRELIDRIAMNGFDTSTPVCGNPNEFTLLEGSHRCAIAIQLGICEVPYTLRFSDDRVDEEIFRKALGDNAFNYLLQKQDEYIGRCDPLTALKCRIRRHMRSYSSSFDAPFSSPTKTPSLRTYQAFERLGISGKRPAQERARIYNLSRYLDKSMRVLEIGCNVGFFSLVVSELVGNVHAFDVDPNYCKIGDMVREFCQILNCQFFTSSVEEFKPGTDGSYDCVISTAVHGWTGMQFGLYVTLISDWLRPNGLLLIESHEIDVEKDWPSKRNLLIENFDVLESGFIDDVDTQLYESEMREFLLLRKRKEINYRELQSTSPVAVVQAKGTWGPDCMRAAAELGRKTHDLSSALFKFGRTLIHPTVRETLKCLRHL